MASKRKSHAKPKTVKKAVAAVPAKVKTDLCKGCPFYSAECAARKTKECLLQWYNEHNPEVLERLGK